MSIREIAQIERIVAKEEWKLLKRDPHKYAAAIAGRYFFNLLVWDDLKLGTTLRSTNSALRIIDDIADLDRVPPDGLSPLQYISDFQQRINTEHHNNEDSLSTLTSYAIKALEQKQRDEDDVAQEFIDAIEIMKQDYLRSQERKILNARELEKYFQSSFDPLINIALIGLGSEMRACDIPRFGALQARTFSIRDLEEDWQAGLLNIPQEILSSANLSSSSSAHEIRKSRTIKLWNKKQLLVAEEEIWETQEILDSYSKPLTSTVLQSSINTVSNIIKDFT
jgi:hypothetical protein